MDGQDQTPAAAPAANPAGAPSAAAPAAPATGGTAPDAAGPDAAGPAAASPAAGTDTAGAADAAGADAAAPATVATAGSSPEGLPADALPADALPADALASDPAGLLGPALEVMDRGGPALWVIAGLSVLTLAAVLWKLWRLSRLGAWRRTRAEEAVAAWTAGHPDRALEIARGGRGLRARAVRAAIEARRDRSMSPADQREETERVCLGLLDEAGAGLRLLEIVASVAPLVGLLGTVLGMITAFQALETTGTRADPAALAGGIWEALLTTAAGMAVAIPAALAHAWFESVLDRLRRDVEDMATRIFTRQPPVALPAAPPLAQPGAQLSLVVSQQAGAPVRWPGSA